jgi:hypothetical protein
MKQRESRVFVVDDDQSVCTSLATLLESDGYTVESFVSAAKSPPAPRVRETQPQPATSTASEVWVNTRSGKYWRPGSRFYGKTKQGEFMSELEALDRGYSPAGGTGQ